MRPTPPADRAQMLDARWQARWWRDLARKLRRRGEMRAANVARRLSTRHNRTWLTSLREDHEKEFTNLRVMFNAECPEYRRILDEERANGEITKGWRCK